jgi:cytochrome c-type biogenesis protein CcmH
MAERTSRPLALLHGAVLALALQAAAVAGLALAAPAARAAEAELAAEDPALEKQVQRITAELRCLVCQNQTIADSHADLAIDLRNQVREMLKKGQTDAEIMAYMTARYGDFVLYRPPVKGSTWLLWFGPALLMVGGVAILFIVLRRRARMAPERFEADEDIGLDEGPPAAGGEAGHEGGAGPSPAATR